jgi:hypothetical protein
MIAIPPLRNYTLDTLSLVIGIDARSVGLAEVAQDE